MMERRTFLASAAALAAASGLGKVSTALAQAAAQAADDDAILAHVHPELRAIAKRILPMTRGSAPLSRATLANERALNAGYARKPRADVPFEKRQIPGSAGRPPVTIFVVNAGRSGLRPAIVHTHGGGFVTGSAQNAVLDLQTLCQQLDCAAISVEYRLAPEATWRDSLEDNYAALKWVHGNAGELGVDPARIAVMGESAGGGHAALLAIAARDRREVSIRFQCLIYPMLDDRTGSSRRVPAHLGQIIWTPQRNRFGWESFLGMKPGGTNVPAGAVPARLRDFAGLPPAFIGVGSIDLFVEEDIAYAERLIAAGVQTELQVVPGAFHGFDGLPAPSKLIAQFKAAKLDALRRGLGLG